MQEIQSSIRVGNTAGRAPEAISLITKSRANVLSVADERR